METITGNKFCYGTMDTQCDNCQLKKNSDLLEAMPDTWRLKQQETMTRIRAGTCEIHNFIYHIPTTAVA